MTDASKDLISDAFQEKFDSTRVGVKTILFHILKCSVTKMARTGTVNDVFHCNVEHCTQSTIFVGAFVMRALDFSRYDSPVARFNRDNLSEQATEHKQ